MGWNAAGASFLRKSAWRPRVATFQLPAEQPPLAASVRFPAVSGAMTTPARPQVPRTQPLFCEQTGAPTSPALAAALYFGSAVLEPMVSRPDLT